MDLLVRWSTCAALVALAGCGATTTTRPARPMILPVMAATAGSPEAALAQALAVPPEQPTCVAFGDDTSDQLCLLAVADPDAGAVTYTLGLARVRGGQWVVTSQINDRLTMKPELYPVGEATASAVLGESVAVSASSRAVELVLEGTWSYDEEGGQSRRDEIRILYWHLGDDLIELVQVHSSSDSSADFGERVTRTYEVLGSGEGALFDLEVTTHTLRESWPDDRHTDETETVRYAWTGAAYEPAVEQPAPDEAPLDDDDDELAEEDEPADDDEAAED